jgi:sorting nexin-1/2
VERYPGAIVPPIPEKLAIGSYPLEKRKKSVVKTKCSSNTGRFQDEFIEVRRSALERCIRKITSHPLLQGDENVKLFLESESFSVDVCFSAATLVQPSE